MRVRDLIKLLKKADPKAIVVYHNSEYGVSMRATDCAIGFYHNRDAADAVDFGDRFSESKQAFGARSTKKCPIVAAVKIK